MIPRRGPTLRLSGVSAGSEYANGTMKLRATRTQPRHELPGSRQERDATADDMHEEHGLRGGVSAEQMVDEGRLIRATVDQAS